MKKSSAMGGGEFEYNPEKLDEKINKRKEYINTAFNKFYNYLINECLEYQKQGLGTFECMGEELIKRLILEWRSNNVNKGI